MEKVQGKPVPRHRAMKPMARILFIGKRRYTNRDALGERFGRIYQLPLQWARQGAQTRLWLIDYHGRHREQRLDDALRVDSSPIRGIGWMAKAIRLIMSRFRRRAPTHIIASGDAYIGLFGWLLARLAGAFFIFDVYDKYDEFAGYRKPFGWHLFGFLLRHADQCWFASRRLLAQLGNSTRGDRLVMNGIDTDRFKPLDMREARRYFGLPERSQLVGYFGSMEKDRGVADLIDTVSMLRQENKDISLVLAGRAHTDTALPQVPWLHYLGNLPFCAIARAYAAVNVVAVPYRRSAFLDAASSVKFGEIMACGRPLVATRTPNIEDNFAEQSSLLCDYLAPPGDPEALARVIVRQLQDQKIVPTPEELKWSALAASALEALFAMVPSDRPSSTP